MPDVGINPGWASLARPAVHSPADGLDNALRGKPALDAVKEAGQGGTALVDWLSPGSHGFDQGDNIWRFDTAMQSNSRRPGKLRGIDTDSAWPV